MPGFHVKKILFESRFATGFFIGYFLVWLSQLRKNLKDKINYYFVISIINTASLKKINLLFYCLFINKSQPFSIYEQNFVGWKPKVNLEKETSKPSNIVENMSDNTSKRLTFPGKLVKLHLCAYSWCNNLHLVIKKLSL